MEQIEIQGIGQIHLTVADVERTVAFYRDVLGMPLLFEVPEQSMAFFDCGGVRLYFGPAEGLDRPSSAVVYYRIGAIDPACEALREHDIELDAPPHVVHRAPGMELWMVFFDDPDGHKIALMEERAVPE